VRVGTPEVEGFQVVAEVVEHGRGEKIRIFKYKNKTRYRRRQGHRQEYTRLSIKEIVSGGKSVSKGEKKTITRPRSMAEPEPEETPVSGEVAEATVAEAPARPKRVRKAAKAEAGDAAAKASEATGTSAEAAVEASVKPARPKRVRAPKKAEAQDAAGTDEEK
jgi:large subunit ribosomal protein L21